MQIEASIPEADLAYVSLGDPVTLTFDWNADSGEVLPGVIAGISAMSDPESAGTVFTLTVDFIPTAGSFTV